MYLNISSGRGPVECERAVVLFSKYLIKYFSLKNIMLKEVTLEKGSESGCAKSILFYVSDDFSYELEGTYLWVCKSSFRKETKRKNWYFDLKIFKENESFSFDEREVKIETFCSGGPGGQHVNKVSSGIRIRYKDISVVATEERSQYRNKKLAFLRLNDILKNKNIEILNEQRNQIWGQHDKIQRGNPKKTFVGENFMEK